MQTTYTRADFVQELGIGTLPRETQDEIIAGVSHNILKHIFLEILLRLPKDAQEEFKLFVEGGKGDDAEALAQKHITDLNAFVRTETRVALDQFKALQRET